MIIKFPKKVGLRHVSVPARKKSLVWLRITDGRNADLVRAQVQFAISRACGFRGLKGWTNETARSGAWHSVAIRPDLVARFLRNMARAVKRGTVEMELNGNAVQMAA
jgi:hypothetical protein